MARLISLVVLLLLIGPISSTGADDGAIYGLRWGTEAPIGGMQASLDFNRSSDVKMDSLILSGLFNFYSHDRRKRTGRVLVNSVSSYISLGVGGTRFEPPESEPSLLFTWEIGLGLQFKFTRSFGLRFDALALSITPKSARNYEGTMGFAFYF